MDSDTNTGIKLNQPRRPLSLVPYKGGLMALDGDIAHLCYYVERQYALGWISKEEYEVWQKEITKRRRERLNEFQSRRTNIYRNETTMPKVRDAIRRIKEDGWQLRRTKGSHRQYRHHEKPGTVTIAGNPGDDLPRGTWTSVLKQAGLKE